jgi:hypothetical protein
MGHNLFDADTIHIPSFDFAAARDEIDNTWTVHKFGCNPDVGTAFETAWVGGGKYAYPAAATVMNLTSASTDDVATSGTGAWTIEIDGLDANYDEQMETLSLNGQSDVATANSYIRIHSLSLKTAGTGGTNAGRIYLGTGTNTAGVPANQYAIIEIDYGRTTQALFTVADGHYGYLYDFTVSCSAAKGITARIMLREFGEAFQARDVVNLNDGQAINVWK